MRNLQLLSLILLGNSVLFSMEKEPKNIVTCYRDSNNQSWRVDREIWLPEKNDLDSDSDDAIWSAWFNKKGTKIRVGDSHEYIHAWDRSNGEYLGKMHEETFVLTKPSDESSDESSDFEPGCTIGGNGQISHSTSGEKELLWLNELSKKLIRLDTNESKTMMVVSKFNHSIAYVWDREVNKEVAQLIHQGNIKKLSVGDAEKIYTLSDDGIMRVWNGKTGEELFKLSCGAGVTSAYFNKVETEIVVATEDGKIQILVKEIS